MKPIACITCLVLLLAACSENNFNNKNAVLEPSVSEDQQSLEDPAEVTVGERLFLETRFAQFFFAHNNGINKPLTSGDPSLTTLVKADSTFPGPFSGASMNCAACHKKWLRKFEQFV